MAVREDDPEHSAAMIVERLSALNQTVATAESITAGGVCAMLTSVSGSSQVVRGGLIVYATDLKATLAGVDQDLLTECGPVHPRIALALATGATEQCRADWGLGLTGVAGPGPQNGIPAGTVHIGLGGPATRTFRSINSRRDRAGVRAEALAGAFELLREYLG